MTDDANPYSAPLTTALEQPVAVGELADAERIRNEFLKHEASVRSIGVLYYLSAAALVLLGVAQFREVSDEGFLAVLIAAVFFGFAALSVFVGRGLRKLQGWARIPVILFSVLGLLNFPIGTLVNGFIIYLVASAKGRRVMTPEYREVVRLTPHIKYKTSPIIIVLLVLLLLLLAVGLGGFLLSSR